MLSTLALVVVIVIDQYRTDQLLRIQQSLNPAGIGKMVKQGIFYDDAHHTQFFNMTCPGHVSISTGAEPGLSGVTVNEDWDPETQKRVYCLGDPEHQWIDAEADGNDLSIVGTSGKRILTTTVGDELKHTWNTDSKVLSLALKDRSAIAMAGHVGDGVYWYAPRSQKFTTSDAYAPGKKLPAWLVQFNSQVKLPPQKDGEYESSLRSIRDLTRLALIAAKEENLGKHKKPDMLWLSYSTHDYVGHDTGDDSEALHDVMKAEDQAVTQLIEGLQKMAGSKKVMFVLTGDHGAGIPTPDFKKFNLPGGKMDSLRQEKVLKDCMKESGVSASQPFIRTYSLNYFLTDQVTDKKSGREKLKQCLIKSESIWNAYTRDEIMEGRIPQTPWLKRLPTTYHPKRGADVIGVLAPYWNSSSAATVNHETPYDYDSWVPLVVWWKGIPKKIVHKRVAVTSLAPTLARILQTRRPSGATAELLTEVLDAAD